MITIEDGQKILLVPENGKPPTWAEDGGYTVVRQPVQAVYLAASSGMDMVDALGCLDRVRFTSTKREDWSLSPVTEALDEGALSYVGKYSAPDYEMLVEGGCTLAVESTMIYHNPKAKEELEALGIPVIVERSSYENDPIGRLEWIRFYGALLGEEDKADVFFDKQQKKVSKILENSKENRSLNKVTGIEQSRNADGSSDSGKPDNAPTMAFFSISDNGYATVRKSGDYVSKMIEMAGAKYVPSDATPEDENALSTMNMQMERFVDETVDADFLIYNSTIQQEVSTISELLGRSELLADYKAVKQGHVWCTNKNVFQKSTAVGDIIRELYQIRTGQDEGLTFFHKVE
ncbi:MAG: ABC transporter substrate-binding protein [Lachnospiraceae bacterium]|nr:ABC transporter substrate-binding protein [Lachnospiraceae bacterium]